MKTDLPEPGGPSSSVMLPGRSLPFMFFRIWKFLVFRPPCTRTAGEQRMHARQGQQAQHAWQAGPAAGPMGRQG